MSLCCLEILILTFLLVLPFLYETSSQFRYYLKFSLYYVIVMATALILIPFIMFRPGEVRNLLLASFFCRHISSLLGIRWELRGQEYLKKDQACIIVANHQSSLDILGMFDMWHIMDKCTVVAKKELLYAWPFGIAAWLCGLVFIDRLHAEKAKESMNEATQHIKHTKTKLWIFPEGTRNKGGSMLPFKKGAFHVAVSSQLPILPAVFSSYYFLDNDSKTFDQGRVIVTVLPPVETVGLSKEDIEPLMEKTRLSMIEEFHRSSAEVLASDIKKKKYCWNSKTNAGAVE